MIKTVINPKYSDLEGFIVDLPNTFIESGEVIYSGRNTIKIFDVNNHIINVKSFKKPLLINQFAYATFRTSKARRSYEYAIRLKAMGFNTPEPIAYMEYQKFLLLKYSVYISVHEKFDGLLQELKQGSFEEKKDFLKQFALFTAQLHEQKVMHLDYSPGNILYKKEGDKYIFYLVDLNRMTFGKIIKLDKACFSFRRLWGSHEMIEYFATEYAKARNFDVDECIKCTFKFRDKFWKTFTAQYPEATPYITE